MDETGSEQRIAVCILRAGNAAPEVHTARLRSRRGGRSLTIVVRHDAPLR
jgi:hypothetical protein